MTETTPEGFTESHWGDLPPAWCRMTNNGVEVVLHEAPRVRWIVNCVMHDGRPRVVRLDMGIVSIGTTTTGVEPTFLDQEVTRPPYRSLAAFWARLMHGVEVGGGKRRGGDLEALITEVQPIDLGQAPSPRPFGGRDTDEYRAALREWSAPVADEIRWAVANMQPVYAHISTKFGKSGKPLGKSRTQELVSIAQKAHGLRKLRGSKTPEPEQVPPFRSEQRRARQTPTT